MVVVGESRETPNPVAFWRVRMMVSSLSWSLSVLIERPVIGKFCPPGYDPGGMVMVLVLLAILKSDDEAALPPERMTSAVAVAARVEEEILTCGRLPPESSLSWLAAVLKERPIPASSLRMV